MTVPRITGAQLSPPSAGPLLVVGPSLGTAVAPLWSACAALLGARFHVVGWDLPGHGSNSTVGDPFTMSELAAGVLALADDLLVERAQPGAAFCYAGDSVGGAVGLQLLLDRPDRIRRAALICTGAKIGSAEMWSERAARVRASGTPVMVSSSALRWFAPGFLDRSPEVGSTLLHSLQDANAEGYAQVCEALADFDVRHRLGEVRSPVLAVAGAFDEATPPGSLAEIAEGVPSARFAVLAEVAHLAPAEQPEQVADLLLDHFASAVSADESADQAQHQEPSAYEAGLAVRREVLGDAHVNRAAATATDFTREFQEFITSYAWGTIWTRPGLDRRSRSLITLTALVARGHHEELAMHVRAARTNGLTNDEIKELLLQTAIYCGVPDANTAFRIAQQVLAELDDRPDEPGDMT